MKTSTPSCSALAQNGWNFGSLISSPLTLPPMAAPRSPNFFTPSSSCSAARSGCCSATVAKATNRSGMRGARLGELRVLDRDDLLRDVALRLYQYGLMLSASTSMPCSSMARMRRASWPCPGSAAGRCPARASGSSARAPRAPRSARGRRRSWRAGRSTTTSRRRGCARAGAAARRSQPTKARPASAPAVTPRSPARRHGGVLLVEPASTAWWRRVVSCAGGAWRQRSNARAPQRKRISVHFQADALIGRRTFADNSRAVRDADGAAEVLSDFISDTPAPSATRRSRRGSTGSSIVAGTVYSRAVGDLLHRAAQDLARARLRQPRHHRARS